MLCTMTIRESIMRAVLTGLVLLAACGAVMGGVDMAEPSALRGTLATAADDLVLPKPSPASKHVALILIAAGGVAPAHYEGVLTAIQKAGGRGGVAVWAAAVKCDDEDELSSAVARAEDALASAGLRQDAPRVVAGHADSGRLAQLHARSVQNIKAVVLLGSYIVRHSNIAGTVPTATILGSRDGVCRPGRVAEVYSRVRRAKLLARHPVLIARDVTHLQILSGPGSAVMIQHDLRPVQTEAKSQFEVARAVMAFMESELVLGGSPAGGILSTMQKEADTFLEPLVQALEFEGSFALNTPCYRLGESDRKEHNCVESAPFVQELVQPAVGGLQMEPHRSLKDVHKFWPINRILPKDYLPAVAARCDVDSDGVPIPATRDCTIETLSYGDLTYPSSYFTDTFSPNRAAADQVTLKLNSRQRVYHAAGLDHPTSVNSNRICAEAMEATLQWVLKRAPQEVRERYESEGMKLAFGDDVEYKWYPSWDSAVVHPVPSPSGNMAVAQSHAMWYPEGIPIFGGFQFCKLLTPAYMMEWVYTDSIPHV